MIIQQCNRCGSIYTGNKNELSSNLLDANEFRSLEYVELFDNTDCLSHTLDLCDDCWQKLFEFLNIKREGE